MFQGPVEPGTPVPAATKAVSSEPPLKGETFIKPERRPANRETWDFIVSLAHELGFTDGRPTSLEGIHLALADYLNAAGRIEEGYFCWPMRRESYSGAIYGYDLARKTFLRLRREGFFAVVQSPKHGTVDATSTAYLADKSLVPDGLMFERHGVGAFIEVRGRRPTNHALKKAMRKAPVLSLKNFPDAEIGRLQGQMQTLVNLWGTQPLIAADGENWARATRVFNNGSLREGGRVYGHWQGRKARERLDFTIGGSAVCEIDVRGSYLFLAGGMSWDLGPDPYLTIAAVREHPAWRKAFKEFTSALLSYSCDRKSFPKAEGGALTFRERHNIPKGITATYFCDQIKEAFPFIDRLTNVGLKLMFQESEITMDAMLALATRGRPEVVYPVHDCLLCKREDEEIVVRALQRSYRKHTAHVPYLEVEFNDRASYTIAPNDKFPCDHGTELVHQTSRIIDPDPLGNYTAIDESDDVQP